VEGIKEAGIQSIGHTGQAVLVGRVCPGKTILEGRIEENIKLPVCSYLFRSAKNLDAF